MTDERQADPALGWRLAMCPHCGEELSVPAQEERLRAARFVATHWRDAVMASDVLRPTGMSHPLALVLAALDGETDPVHLGISEDQHDAYHRALGDESKEER